MLILGLVSNSFISNSYSDNVEEITTTSSTIVNDEEGNKENTNEISEIIDSITENQEVSEEPLTSKSSEDIIKNQSEDSNDISSVPKESTNSKKKTKANFAVTQEEIDLNDWEYQDNENELILIKHKGDATSLVIPAEITVNGITKSVSLSSLNANTVGNPISLTIKEINGKKVKLVDANLSSAFEIARISSLDFRGLDTSNVTSMARMFYQSGLQTANFLGMDTSNVTDMSQMFTYTPLTNLQQDFNTEKVTDMHNMFAGLSSSPKQLNVNNFNVSNVTNVSRMFASIPSILYYDLSNWHFEYSDVNFNQMFSIFGGNAYKPLLVVTDDSQLLAQNFDYDSGISSKPAVQYRSPAGPYFDGGSAYNDEGSIGVFSNNYRFQRFFTDFFVKPDDPKLDLSKIKEFITKEEQDVPTLNPAASYDFIGYTLNSGGIDPQNAIQISDLFNNIYTAQWLNQKINSSVDNKNLTPNSSLLGFAYLPNSFSTETVELNASGQQEIPLQKSESFNIGVKDRTRTNNEWTVTATFNWTGGMEIPDAYIQADNPSGTIMDNWNDGDYAYNPSTDLHSLNSNDVTGIPNFKLKNGETISVMSTNSQTNKNGVYDYNLGNVKLVIPDVSQVRVGTYSGEVHWNLNNAPI